VARLAPRNAQSMIRVAIADDHPAVQVGLQAALRAEPGLVPVGVAGSPAELEPLLYRTRPDVVLLDYHLPGADGLTVCRRLKADPPSPAVLLYSAFADESLTVPALVAGADGIVHKSAAPRELFDAIRRVARGEGAMPPVSDRMLRAAADVLDEQDLPILAMLVDRTTPAEIGDALRIPRAAVSARIPAILARIKAPVPAAAGRGAAA
jgi:DNA-binding NarL/FixJ family response regulator